MHPGVNDLHTLSDPIIEQKLQQLTSVYFSTQNEAVRQQVVLLIDTYKLELEERKANSRLKDQQNGNNTLDKLIKVR